MAINGQSVASSNDVVRIVGASAPNAQVRLDVARGGARSMQVATLGRADQVFNDVQPVSIRTSAMFRGGTPHFVFPDHLGAPIPEFDENGEGADWSYPGAYSHRGY